METNKPFLENVNKLEATQEYTPTNYCMVKKVLEDCVINDLFGQSECNQINHCPDEKVLAEGVMNKSTTEKKS